jgi:hypothetical protein
MEVSTRSSGAVHKTSATDEAAEPRAVLIDSLLAESEAIARRTVTEIRAQMPSYELIPEDEHAIGVQLAFAQVLGAARDGRLDPGDHELDELAATGEERARMGLSLDDLLHAWRIGVQVAVREARAAGTRLGVDPIRVLDLVESVLAWSDRGMAAHAEGHRRATLELERADERQRAAFVAGVLQGTLASSEIRGHAETYRVDPERVYLALRLRPVGGATHEQLVRALGLFGGAHGHGLAAVVEGDLAGFVRESPANVTSAVVGVGPPRRLEHLAESFRLATRALSTADGFGLEGIHDLSTLGLRPAIAADRDVGDAVCARYLDPLSASGAEAELPASLRAYFACGMRVEPAAEKLFVHPNTLRYRISRFEELTGASLRDPTVAFEVWWALERASLRA